MIRDDFIFDFEEKVISFRDSGSENLYTVRELYSAVQDLMDDPVNMIYETPIVAKSPTEFRLVHGWKLDPVARKHLKDGRLTVK